MTPSQPVSTRTAGSPRRWIGYSASIAVNAILLYALLGWPGWGVVPFVGAGFDQVLGWVVAGLTASIVANVVYLVTDPPALRTVGQLVINVIGLVALSRLWQVFPFEFADGAFPWATIVRVLLAMAMAGTAIACVVFIVRTVLILIDPDNADVQRSSRPRALARHDLPPVDHPRRGC